MNLSKTPLNIRHKKTNVTFITNLCYATFKPYEICKPSNISNDPS